MKFSSDRSVTTSKCIALVLGQVNKHKYTFCSPPELRTNSAPVKSTSVTLNEQSVCDLGSGGAFGAE